MISDNFFHMYFSEISKAVESADLESLKESIKIINDCSAKNGKLILVGNGGSAAMASHVSVDFTKTANIRAVNFNEADLITCFGNDYGYENWVAKAIEAYADTNDVVILVSSSGSSKNIINGATKSVSMKLTTVTLTGFDYDNPVKKIGDINLWVDSSSYNVVEMTHHIWLLAMVDKIAVAK